MKPFSLKAQIAEISADVALRCCGAALALTHALSMLFWRRLDAVRLVARDAEAICWPLVPDCETLRVLSLEQVAWGLRGYFGLSIVIAALFLLKRTTVLAYAGLAALTLGKLLFLALDFRLRANQHYMAFWVSLAFLLLPDKRNTLRVLLVLFYVWASTLKFHPDWISGAALPHPLWLIPPAWTSAACIYVIVLELGVSWGLLARRSWVFWGALSQFLLFHVMSWGEVGFFYPMLMFLLLPVFPLARLIPRPAPPGGAPAPEPSLLTALLRFRLRPSTYAMAAVFSLLQLVPVLIPGDDTVTGEGRLWALHMVDARMECRATAAVRRRDGSEVTVPLTGRTVLRIACDPIVVAERARNICEQTSALVRDAVELDLRLLSRRLSEPTLRPVIDLPGFCARRIRYNPFGHNWWIQIGGSADGPRGG